MSDIDDARKELEDEYEQVRHHLHKVREALATLEAAGPESNLFELLDQLEKAVHEVRTGGLVGSGAKGHREALERFQKLRG